MVFGPPRYEVRHLEALRAVAEEGTFRGAADVLGYSQAAISQQIAGLEALVGSPVFERPGGPKPVILTPVGRALLGKREGDEISVQVPKGRVDYEVISVSFLGTAGLK